MYGIAFRLKVVSVVTFIALAFLAYNGISGMRQSGHAIESLYSEGMQHTIRAGKILDDLGDARSALLLSFQHDPSSPLASMHDHPLDLHLQEIDKSLTLLHTIIDKEILPSDLAPDERAQVDVLAKELDRISDEGFAKAVQAIRNGDFLTANRITLEVINPQFKQVRQAAMQFLSFQSEEAKQDFLQSQDNIQSFNWQFGLVSMIAALLIISVTVMIIRRFDYSSHQLETTAKAIADGNLTQRINMKGDDEFTHIATCVNDIAGRFQHVIQTNKSSLEQLAVAAEESSAVAAQTQQNILDQQAETQQIAAAIHEFNATVHEVAQSAANAAEASDIADRAAASGQSEVKSSMEMIESLSHEMQDAVTAMQTLAGHAQEIGGVVDVIQGISEQTNLLALNAAIEAARAGEFGRGFAVVADEVRTLASRTQASTQEILSTIQRLQDGSKDAMQRLESGAKNALVTVEKAQLAAEALTHITQSVDAINNMNTQIATAAEEQSSVTEEINKNITSISDIANETAAGAEQSARTTQELAKLSEVIREEIQRFQV